MKQPTVEEKMSMMTVMKEIQTVIRWSINRDSTKICLTERNSSHYLALVIIILRYSWIREVLIFQQVISIILLYEILLCHKVLSISS